MPRTQYTKGFLKGYEEAVEDIVRLTKYAKYSDPQKIENALRRFLEEMTSAFPEIKEKI